jgi:hypothetical protein
MARLSGLQRDVLSLYRQCLRAARAKPAVSVFKAIWNEVKDVLGLACVLIRNPGKSRTFPGSG